MSFVLVFMIGIFLSRVQKGTWMVIDETNMEFILLAFVTKL